MKQEIKKIARQAAKELILKDKNRSYIPVSGKVFDEKELQTLIEASLEGWWTEGKWTEKFEKKLGNFLNIKNVLACNSGSSANLLAFSTLRSSTLKDKRIKAGSEVITVAAGFPTTVNVIIQSGCVPVFVDISLPTYNIDVSKLEKALSRKTKAVMVAHTLGNPFEIDKVKAFCKKHSLWLIEDNCDALGSKYKGKYTGGFGHIATLSFYPAHHITTAEGGAVLTNDKQLAKIARSIRDWGRHCWCATGQDNTCKNRFNWKLGNLPEGYDHKYIYGELGFNLKISDLHSSIGVAQMDRLGGFIKKRRKNFDCLNRKMALLEKYFILPSATKSSEPSWFGYLLTIKEDKIDRTELLKYLETHGIGARLLFGGNIIKQPYFTNNKDIEYRVVGKLKNTDEAMHSTFWIGLWPALSERDLNRIAGSIAEFILMKKREQD